MNIEVIERLSEDDDSIGLNFVHSDGSMSTVLFPKEETDKLYGELLKVTNYMFKHMLKMPTLDTEQY